MVKINSLFNTEWTVGDLSSITSVKNLLALIAVTVISFVGFGIVISTIMKNAVAGLYATNPRLWDKVNTAKKRHMEGGSTNRWQGIADTILSWFPDIKGFTDFEDGNAVDPKGYFLRAIPTMIISVFVGIFIFYGYPTKIAEKFGSVGREVLDVALANIDPVEWVSNVYTKFTRPDFATDGAKDDYNKAVNDISSTIWTTYVGKLTDMTKEKRVDIGYKIEDWVIQTATEYAEYTNKDKYKIAIESRVYTQGIPNLEYVHDQLDETSGIYTVAYTKCMEDFAPGSTIDTSNMYIAYFLTFVPVASKTDSISIVCKMTVGSPVYSKNGKEASLVIPSLTDSLTCKISCEDGSGDFGSTGVSIHIEGNELIFTSKQGKLSGTAITNIGRVYYVINGQKHKIDLIEFNNNVTKPQFEAVDQSLNITGWVFGEDPTVEKDLKPDTDRFSNDNIETSGGMDDW